jgi:hypothetical protein
VQLIPGVESRVLYMASTYRPLYGNYMYNMAFRPILIHLSILSGSKPVLQISI